VKPTQRLAAAVAALALHGCVSFDYVLQAAEGQLDLACRAQSIDAAIENDELDQRTRELLRDVKKVKAFATESGLTPTSSYETFVNLDRPAVVWVVSAAPPLSLEPERWWFPVAGSVPYLGWFDKNLAVQQARWLQEDGLDVDIRGAAAYSTLGWFNDPVLSTMIENAPDALAELANTILHESVHATVYIPGQSSFNEGLATYLGDQLTIRYLDLRFGQNSAELAEWLEGEARGREVHLRFHQAYKQLEALYKSKKPRSEKLAEKQKILAETRADVGFRRPITNATLANFSTYHSSREDFGRLYEACGKDLRRVIKVAESVKASDFEQPNAEELSSTIEALLPRCAQTAAPARPAAEAPVAH
jgi:predicted aminopeptidase